MVGLLNRRGYGVGLALGAATPVGAAAVVGAVAVPTFYAVALGCLIGIFLRTLQRARWAPGASMPIVPGLRPLGLLVVVGVLVTMIAPLLFDGLPVLSPSGADARLVAGVLTKSNVAQIMYLVLSISVVAFLARSRWAGPELIGAAAISATVLSFWAWAGTSGFPYPAGIFDNSPAFAFQETLPGGLPRVRGIFSEPAGLAGSSLITISYAVARFRFVAGARRIGLALVIAMAAFLGSISTSATFFVAGAALAIVAVLAGTLPFLLRRGPLRRSTIAVLCGAAVAALWVLPLVAALLQGVVEEKVPSSSFSDRTGADTYSLQLVSDTLGLGTGLGSNRASSFVASLLSTVGVVGALLFVVGVGMLVRSTLDLPEVRPVVWALVALLLTKTISGPDLADANGILWMGLGVLAHATLSRARQSVGPPSGGPGSRTTARGMPPRRTPGLTERSERHNHDPA